MSTALMARKQKRNPKTVAIAKAILDEYNCKNVEDMQDAIKDIFGPMFEAMLQGGMDSHLGYESNDHGPKSTKNRRNGYNSKTLKSTYGDIPVEVPRERSMELEDLLEDVLIQIQELREEFTSALDDIEDIITSG